MSVTFNQRGNSFTPRVNGTGGPTYAERGTITANVTDASAIGGKVLDFSSGGLGQHGLSFNGVGNWPSTKACSILMRVKFVALAGGIQSLFYCGGGTRLCPGGFMAYIDSTNIVVRHLNEIGQVGINSVSFAHGGLSNGTWYDIVITFTGDTTANGCKVYINASSIGSTTSGRTWNDPRIPNYRALEFGLYEASNNSDYTLNEIVIWDEIITPSSVGLVGGSGSLNGASRTAFVDTTASDGSAVSSGVASGILLGGGYGVRY